AMPNRNSSPTYRWATPFTRLRKENSFGEYVKYNWTCVLFKFLHVYLKNVFENMANINTGL
ncbi:hypothetical protein ACQKIU_18165, partial [Bacillus cereus]|uniref:hypothetical protein n=1 Tax=Bacillus cereus TaxID=1396 RepID=UPI003D03D010